MNYYPVEKIMDVEPGDEKLINFKTEDLSIIIDISNDVHKSK